MRERLNTLLMKVNKYTHVANAVTQSPPSVLSLAGAAIRILWQVFPPFAACLRTENYLPSQVAITHMEYKFIAMESMDSIAQSLGNCSICEKFYGQPALVSSKSLNPALIDLYVLILEYISVVHGNRRRQRGSKKFPPAT